MTLWQISPYTPRARGSQPLSFLNKVVTTAAGLRPVPYPYTAPGTHCSHIIMVINATKRRTSRQWHGLLPRSYLPARDTTTWCPDDLPIVNTTYAVHKANCASPLCSILELNLSHIHTVKMSDFASGGTILVLYTPPPYHYVPPPQPSCRSRHPLFGAAYAPCRCLLDQPHTPFCEGPPARPFLNENDIYY